MTSVKANWETRSLRDWGMQAQPGFASGRHNSEGIGLIHLRPMNISRDGRIVLDELKYVEDDSNRRVRHGDVLFNNTNSDVWVGKTAYVSSEHPFAFSNHMTRLRFPENVIDPKFMAMKLHSLWMMGYFKEICSNHVNQASVSTRRLSQVQVSIPSIVEQRQIVQILEDHLSRLDSALADVKHARVKADQLQRSLLEATFAGNYADTTFQEVELGEIASIINGDRGKNYPSRSVRVTKGVPFINAGHLVANELDLEDMDFISEERFDLLGSGKVQKSDLLFCLRGSLGKVALLRELDRGAIASSLAIVRPNKKVSPHFLLYYFQSPLAERMIKQYNNGTAQPNLSGASLKKFKVPLPSLAAQKRIVNSLEEQFLNLARIVSTAMQIEFAGSTLRRSLLQSAFTGQLTKGVARV